MKGLILKDIFSLKKHYVSTMKTVIGINAFFVMFAVGSVHGNLKGYLDFSMFLFMICLVPMIVGTVGMTAVQYDLTSGFREFEIAMPVTDEKKVLAKYIVCFIYLISSAVYIIIPVICCILAGQEFDLKVIFMYLFMMELTALYGLVCIPASMFGNDANKARMVVNLVMILLGISAGGLGGIAAQTGSAALEAIWENIGLAALILLPVLAVCFAVSYFLALKAYRLKRGVTTSVSGGTRPKDGGQTPSDLARLFGMK
jgi:hypothetical protein